MRTRTSTKFLKASLALVAVLLWGSMSYAQTHRLIITAPAGNADTLEAQIAGFGPLPCDILSLSGDAVRTEGGDGNTVCDTALNDLTGLIGVIDRGGCAFVDKVSNAEEKGAVGVIVVNVTEPNDVFTMGGDLDTDVPSFMVRGADADNLEAAIEGGGVAAVTIEKITPAYEGDDIIWPANATDSTYSEFSYDFEASPDLFWTAINQSCAGGEMPFDTFNLWQWSAVGEAPGGSCGNGLLASPTQCDGTASFASDAYDPGGCPPGNPEGNCSSSQLGSLRSGWIEIPEGTAPGYILRFYQGFRQFQSTTSVAWRSGLNEPWDTTVVNSEVEVNNTAFSAPLRVPLAGVAGSGGAGNPDSVQVEFIYDANYYFWLIDDVQIVPQELNNLRVNQFFTIPANAITPFGQEEPIYFLADIENVGAAAQPNTNLDVVIEDGGGTEIYLGTNSYGTVPSNTLVENVNFPETYTHDAGTGTFTGTYVVASDSTDAFPDDNSQSFTYMVSDSVFAKEMGATRDVFPAATNWMDGDLRQWAYGNAFYVTEAETIDGTPIEATSVTFSLGNAEEAATFDEPTLFLTLYKWEDENPDMDPSDGIDDAMDPNEREVVAQTFYTIQGDETLDDLITVSLRDFITGEFAQLEPNTMYVMMVEHFNSSNTDEQIVSYGASEDFDYSATVLAAVQADGIRQYGGLLGVAGDLAAESYSTVGFGRDIVPVIRLNVTPLGTVSTTNLPELTQEFNLYPNPTEGQLAVEFDLKEASDNVVLRVFDLSGKQVDEYRYQNIQRETFNYDMGQLASGTYLMQLVTDRGTATKRFTISK